MLTAIDVVGKEDSLNIATFPYPPFMNEHPVGNKKGLEIEIFEEALKPLKIKTNYKFLPISRAVMNTINYAKHDYPIYIGTSLHFKEEIQAKKLIPIEIGTP